jgi:hypothetical protein
MTKSDIALHYRRAIVFDKDAKTVGHPAEAAVVIAELVRNGFSPTAGLVEALMRATLKRLTHIHRNVLPVICRLKGADVTHQPMYPNFPQQVMEASYTELFMNAVMHYVSEGTWLPTYRTQLREFSLEGNFTEIGVISQTDFRGIFRKILESKESISDYDKETLNWFMDNQRSQVLIPDPIPYKENMCTFAALLIERDRFETLEQLPKTATDVLRIATVLSGGDASLCANVKFRSFPKKLRRALSAAIERVANPDDILRHKNKWVRLFHGLHVGDFSEKLFNLAKFVRGGQKQKTFNGMIQGFIDQGAYFTAADTLKQRPGEFARRLDHFMRTAPYGQGKAIADMFMSVAGEVETRVLLQLMGRLNPTASRERRVVFPKGKAQKAITLKGHVPQWRDVDPASVRTRLSALLADRFAKLEPLGNVYVDPDLHGCPLPTQQRSASEGLFQVARGTHMPIGEKDTLRFFIYWIGRDIDLSATLHGEDFGVKGQLSYTNLRVSNIVGACHSGDITQAPTGASEFIDIPIAKALSRGIRYIVMNVFVYSGPEFDEHKRVFAGWMTRESPQSNEVFDPKTVMQRVDLTSHSRNAIPVVFDLLERKAIWADLTTKGRSANFEAPITLGNFPIGINSQGNNVESNKSTIEEVLAAIVNLDSKVSLGELFALHGMARGTIVDTVEEADAVFSMTKGITPYNVTEINAEYL